MQKLLSFFATMNVVSLLTTELFFESIQRV